MAGEAPRNWVKAMGRQWLPLDLLPAKMPDALLFTNADRTKQWIVENPTPDPAKLRGHDRVHRRGEEGEGFLHDRKGKPVVDEEVIEAAFWSLVEFI